MALYTIQFKRGQSATWTKKNLLLAPGEPGFEIDTGRLKIGNGKDFWNDLPYQDTDTDTTGVVNFATADQFPGVGQVDIIYKAQDEKKLYQWNPNTSLYEVLSNGDFTVNLINGGNANGTI